MRTRVPGVQRPRQPRGLRRFTVALATVALIGGGPALATAPATAQAPAGSLATASLPSDTVVKVAARKRLARTTYERRVKRIINRKRAHHGAGALRYARCPDLTAMRWARHLAAKGEFHHQSMLDIIYECNAVYAGETLGRGGMGPRKLVRMWMESPPHRAVLLNPRSKRIGIGAATDADGDWVVAANFMEF